MNIIQHKYIRILFGAAYALILICLAIIYVDIVPSIQTEGGVFILHFSGYRGIDLIGTLSSLLGLIAFSVVIICCNFILAQIFLSRMEIISYLLAAAACIVALFLFFFVAVVASIN